MLTIAELLVEIMTCLQGQPEDNECDPKVTRIRGYRATLHKRCQPVGTKKMVELVIDNVTAADTGNYTCRLVDFDWNTFEDKFEDATVTLVVGRLALTTSLLLVNVVCPLCTIKTSRRLSVSIKGNSRNNYPSFLPPFSQSTQCLLYINLCSRCFQIIQ